MALNEIKRAYNFGDDVLWQKGDSLVDSMQRDLADFATRNVDNARIDEVAALSNQFKNLPTDAELLGVVTTPTETKNATAFELRKRISTVRNMAETKYGNNGKFKTFDFGTLSLLPDSDLYRTAKRVVRVGTNFLEDLTTEGLTAALLSEITTYASNLDDNLDSMEAAMEMRDIKTQERIIAGNELWALMVKYANIGKSLYEFSDEARYNDYVLTDGGSADSPPTPPAP